MIAWREFSSIVTRMVPGWVKILPSFLRRVLEERRYLQRVVANTGWVFAERLLRYTVGFLIGIWVARYLGPSEYGLLNYSLAFVTVFAFLSTLGVEPLAVRAMVKDGAARDETIGTLVALRLIGGLLLVIVVIAGATLLHLGDALAIPLIVFVSFAHFIQAFDAIDSWFQSALILRFSFAAKATAVLTGALIRILLIASHAPLIAFAWAILAESTVLAVGMLLAYRRSGASLAAMRPRLSKALSLLSEGWPLMLSACVAALYLRIDHVLLGRMVGFAEVGAYAVATRVVEVSYILPAVLMAAVFPAMVKSRESDPAMYDARIQRLFDLIVWLAFCIAIPTSLFASAIVDLLLSNAYAAAGPVLAVLAWMPVLVSFGMVRQKWLIAENALRVAMLVEVVGCALNVLLNLMMIPRFGAVGAAWSALFAAAGSTLLLFPFVPSIRRSLRMFVVAVAAPLRLLILGPRYL